jgi:putative endonuclease
MPTMADLAYRPAPPYHKDGMEHSPENSSQPRSRLPWWRRWFGMRAETAVARYIKHQGYRILARNYRCSHGEIDLIAIDGNCLVFIEVRSTAGERTERPALSVDRTKQNRLTRLALHYLQSNHLLGRPARLDVIAVSWPANAKVPQIDHYQNAFEATDRFQMFS